MVYAMPITTVKVEVLVRNDFHPALHWGHGHQQLKNFVGELEDLLGLLLASDSPELFCAAGHGHDNDTRRKNLGLTKWLQPLNHDNDDTPRTFMNQHQSAL